MISQMSPNQMFAQWVKINGNLNRLKPMKTIYIYVGLGNYTSLVLVCQQDLVTMCMQAGTQKPLLMVLQKACIRQLQ